MIYPTLLQYPGSKSRLADLLTSLHPPHETYVSVFGGTGVEFLAKPRSKIEIYNDKDQLLTTTFRVLQDREKYKELFWRLKYARVARTELMRSHEIAVHPDQHADTDVAYATLYIGATTKAVHPLFARGRPAVGIRYKLHTLPRIIPVYRKRFENVLIENLDWEEVIERYDSQNTLFYCDPPYCSGTRRPKRYYDHDFSLEDHERFLRTLTTVQGHVILSGYNNPLYECELNDWKVITKETRMTMGMKRHERYSKKNRVHLDKLQSTNRRKNHDNEAA